MFRTHLSHALALAAALALPAFAQTKVGIINTQRAVLETAEIKKAAAELEAKFRPQQQEMEKRSKELEGIQQKLSDTSKLKPQEAAELQADGQRKQRSLQRLSEDLQGEVDRERNEILQRGGQRMQQVVAKLAEEKGLDMVVDVSNTIYFKPALEFTSEAIAAYDKQHPVK